MIGAFAGSRAPYLCGTSKHFLESDDERVLNPAENAQLVVHRAKVLLSAHQFDGVKAFAD